MTLGEKAKRIFRILQFQKQRRKIRRLFLKFYGYEGNFENPQTYEEKVQFRKLYGNHEFYGRLADKVLVRDYVKERIGERYLVPLLGVYDRLEERIFDELPSAFVIKVTNASDWNQIVLDKSKVDLLRTIRFFNRKVREKYSRRKGEAHYDYCRPRIVIEKLLLDGGIPPWSTKLFCYNGHRGFDFATLVLSPDERHRGHFDRDWNFLDGNLSPEMTARHAPSKLFPEMVEVARELSRGIDFVRVDLYEDGDRVWFGELTFTSSAGFARIKNPARARMRNEMWELDRHNALLYREPSVVRSGR